MAVNKKIPMRKCVGCGEMKPKKELLRILRTETGEFVVAQTIKHEQKDFLHEQALKNLY